MRTLASLCLALVLAACGAPAPASQAPGALEIRDAWAAPTPGGVDVSAGYLVIVNDTQEDDRLVAAASPRAERVEVHEMAFEGAVMRMRPVEGLAVPTGTEVELAPAGMHLMFFGVTRPFAEGEEIPVTLTFERAGERQVTLPVRRGASEAHAMP